MMVITVKVLKIRTPKTFVIIIPKNVEQCGSTIYGRVMLVRLKDADAWSSLSGSTLFAETCLSEIDFAD